MCFTRCSSSSTYALKDLKLVLLCDLLPKKKCGRVQKISYLVNRLGCFSVSSNPHGSLKMIHDEQIGLLPSHLTFFRRHVLQAYMEISKIHAGSILVSSTNLSSVYSLHTRFLPFHAWIISIKATLLERSINDTNISLILSCADLSNAGSLKF